MRDVFSWIIELWNDFRAGRIDDRLPPMFILQTRKLLRKNRYGIAVWAFYLSQTALTLAVLCLVDPMHPVTLFEQILQISFYAPMLVLSFSVDIFTDSLVMTNRDQLLFYTGITNRELVKGKFLASILTSIAAVCTVSPFIAVLFVTARFNFSWAVFIPIYLWFIMLSINCSYFTVESLALSCKNILVKLIGLIVVYMVLAFMETEAAFLLIFFAPNLRSSLFASYIDPMSFWLTYSALIITMILGCVMLYRQAIYNIRKDVSLIVRILWSFVSFTLLIAVKISVTAACVYAFFMK